VKRHSDDEFGATGPPNEDVLGELLERLAKSEKRQNRNNNNDQAYDVDDVVHEIPSDGEMTILLQ
jgi:hypothetical protein